MRMEDLINKIADFEGFRSQPYICAGGVKTIGYGFTDKELTSRDYMSQEEAYRILVDKVVELCARVHVRMRYLGYTDLTDAQYYALTSFTYNLGLGSLDQLTANGTRSKEEIADKMLLYCKAAGQTLQGLVKRRAWEKMVFVSGQCEQTNTYIDNDVAKIQRTINHIIDILNSKGWNEVEINKLDVDGIAGFKTNYAIQVILNAVIEMWR